MIIKETERITVYDTPNEIVEEREKKKYGGITRGEVLQELQNLEEMVFDMAGSGDIEDAWAIIREERGMVEVLHEIFLDRMGDEDRGDLFFKPSDSFPERLLKVRNMLFEDCQMPAQIYDPIAKYRFVYGAIGKK